MNQTVIILIALVFAFMILMGNSGNHTTEGYSTKGSAYYPSNYVDPYYLPRTYGHEINHCDTSRYDRYPYDYNPKPHPARYDYYQPYFYRYGYGNL